MEVAFFFRREFTLKLQAQKFRSKRIKEIRNERTDVQRLRTMNRLSRLRERDMKKIMERE
ncbi:hypothetical protein Sjap_014366 [Stephania japonica]|uniref:Uncharacterized protein n=1 Tax=Stephania japonica TaxID=461633 RepID=A0AAP0NZX2_9MAGN